MFLKTIKLLVDGAHNPLAASVIRKYLTKLKYGKKNLYDSRYDGKQRTQKIHSNP